jgi:FG-GAP repeat protein
MSTFPILLVALAQNAGGAWVELPSVQGTPLADHNTFCSPGDLTGDGVSDFVLIGGGEIRLYSRGESIVVANAPLGGTAHVVQVHAVGDLTGDDVPDFCLGRRDGDLTLYSGADLLPALSWSSTSSEIAKALAVLPDRDQDGVPDLAVGAPDLSQVFLVSGASGAVLGSIAPGWQGWRRSSQAGSSLILGDDVNGDGLPDLLVGSPGIGNTLALVSCHSLSTGRSLWYADRIPGAFESMGLVGDVNGDGLRDFVESRARHNEYSEAVRCRSGADGQVLWTYSGRPKREFLGRSFVSLPDLDGDGVEDIAIGCHDNQNIRRRNGIRFLSARTGIQIPHPRIPDIQTSSQYQRLGSNLQMIPDAFGPGWPAVASMDKDYGLVTYGLQPCLTSDRLTLSLGSGEVASLTVDFPATEAGVHYRILASRTGQEVKWTDGVPIPLTRDSLFHWSATLRSARFPGQMGTLNAEGDASAQLRVPAWGASAMETLYLCAVAVDLSSGKISRSSQALALELLP